LLSHIHCCLSQVVETGKVCLTGAYVDLNEGEKAEAGASTSTSSTPALVLAI